MKKILTMILCVCMCLQLAGCGNAWVKEGTDLISEDIRSGEFVLDGEVYKFPMPLQTWLDRGWEVSSSYENRDEFLLQPGSTSSDFEIFNENDEYVTVEVYNGLTEPAKIEDCMVCYLSMSMTGDMNIVLPQGIYSKSKPTQIIEAYGEPDSEESKSGTVETWYEYTDGDWICQINLFAYDSATTQYPLSDVKYEVVGDKSWVEFMENAGGESGCATYIDAALGTVCKGEYDAYVQNSFGTQEDAEALYSYGISYYASILMYYADVYQEYLDDETYAQYCEIAKQVLAKTDWEIVEVTLTKDGMLGDVEINLYPTDFLTLINPDLEETMDIFMTKYWDADFDAMSDEEYAACELDYANMVLDAIGGRAEECQTLSAINKVYGVDYNAGILSAEDWQNMEDILMGVAE